MKEFFEDIKSYFFQTSSFALILTIIFLVICLLVWMFLPGFLTKWRCYPSYKDKAEDLERYRRNIGLVLTIPALVITALFTLHQAGRAARESAEKAYQERYAFGFQSLGGDQSSTRLGGVYAIAQLIGGLRENNHCPDGNGSDHKLDVNWEKNENIFEKIATSSEKQIYVAGVLGLAAHAASSSHRDHLWGTEQDHTAVINPDTFAALSVLAKRRCETYTYEIPLYLAGGYYRGSFINYGQFVRSDMRGSDFTASEIYYANFFQSRLDKARFDGSNLTSSSFARAYLPGASFKPDVNLASPLVPPFPWQRTKAGGVQFLSTYLEGANFFCAMLNDARFDSSLLAQADFTHATLANARFWSVKGYAMHMSNVCAPAVDFSYDPKIDAPASRSEVKSSTFAGSYLQKANFKGADLTNSDFTGADLRQSNFAEANLSNVNFSNANLSQAKFSNSNLTGTIFKGAILCEAEGLTLPDATTHCEQAPAWVPVTSAPGADGDCLPLILGGRGSERDLKCPVDLPVPP